MIPDDQFSAALDRSLAMGDVRSALADPDVYVDRAFVREQLVRRKADIESQIGSAHRELFEAIRDVGEREAQRLAARSPPAHREWSKPLLYWVLGLSVFPGMGALKQEWASLVQLDYFSWSHGIVLAIAAVVLPIIVADRRWKTRLAAIIAEQANDPVLAASQGRADLAAKRLEQAIDQAVTRTTFEIVGESGLPFHQRLLMTVADGARTDLPLKASSPRGLSETVGQGHEVPTAERHELLHLMQTLPGASIGLSGPRGAGKSTLLRSLTESNLRLREREAVAVYTAAPVEYEARDFLLHIFATLCRRVLATHGAGPAPPREADPGEGSLLTKASGRALRSYLLLFGTMACVVSAFVGALDLKPGPLLLFGIMALLLWLTLAIPESFRRARAELEQEIGVPAATRKVILRSIWRMLRRRRVRQDDPELEPVENELVPLSRMHLADIRFQRSFASGWSGAIKVPLGFDLGATSSTSFAERQESLPELVERFCGYVRRVVAVHGTVVIAIDELDKLKSAAEAERLINELKSIFNITGCFYLVSVSEDALSTFERRGLGLRDAFDSAFDDIRHVGHMGLQESRNMLTRRVLSLPDPFLCLCYILSGGLPRDLIRAARDMFDLVRPGSPPMDIATVARRLLEEEARAKLRSAIAATRNIALEPETSQFILAVTELQEGRLDDPQFRDRLAALAVADRPDASKDQRSRLEAIQRELAAYLRFLAQTLALANAIATERGWKTAHKSGKIEQLAEIRRALEWNIAAASARLTKIAPRAMRPPRRRSQP
ncbi:MAG: hypothetical protein ABWX67_16900 [Allosphingosinicella sp.]